jgi:SAM-dependent methyltransferase
LSIEKWDERYRAGEQLFDKPSPLVQRYASDLAAGVALDLACGAGRNAIYLVERGWHVTAVDGSPIAIAKLEERALAKNLELEARVADLERGEFQIEPDSYDLICDCYYLQRDLVPVMQAGIRRGGMAIVIVHLTDVDKPEGTPRRARPGELRDCFADWSILHYNEGPPGEVCHQRAVAELVALRL